MDFNSLFRGFFHSPRYHREPFSPHDDERSERNDCVVFHDNFESFDPNISAFHHMEDMFIKMFSSSFGVFGFPRFADDLPSQETNPRTIMIKDPDQKTCDPSSYTKDFGESGLLLNDESGKEEEKSRSFSYSKFSSIKTVHLPDATVAEHRTMIDYDGNKTTTVRRTIGETSYEVLTKSDKQGIKEQRENFTNMDENELSSFEQMWNNLKDGDNVNPRVPSISLHESNPSYIYHLKKYIGPLLKGEMKWI